MKRCRTVAFSALLTAVFLAAGHGTWLVRRVSVCVDIKFREPAVFQVFFADEEETGLRFKTSLATTVEPGGKHVEFSLPIERLEHIRFDFGTAPGKIRAGPVVIRGTETRVLDWRDFRGRRDIGRFDVDEKGAVNIVATGGDPYAACPKTIGIRGRLRPDFGTMLYFVFLSALVGWLLFESGNSEQVPVRRPSKCNAAGCLTAAETPLPKGNRRNPTFDLAKFLLMLGVVSGHFLAFQFVKFDPFRTPGLNLARNALNMPAFFLIGGCMAAAAFDCGSWRKIVSRTIRLLWPTVPFFVFLSTVAFLSGWVPWLAFARFPRWLWFLRAYALVFLLSALLYRLGKTDRLRWALFGFAWMAMTAIGVWLPVDARFWIPRFAWEPTMAFRCFLPFAFGLFVLRRRPFHENPRTAAVCGLIFYGGIAAGMANEAVARGLNPYRMLDPGTAPPAQIVSCLLLHPLVAASGTVFLLGLCHVLARRFPRTVAILAPLGAASLGIYLLHEWPLLAVFWNKHGIRIPSWTLWPATIVWTVFCAKVAGWIGRHRVLALILFGMTSRKKET